MKPVRIILSESFNVNTKKNSPRQKFCGELLRSFKHAICPNAIEFFAGDGMFD